MRKQIYSTPALRRTARLTALLLLMVVAQHVDAEPYLAVREGLRCGVCHSNPAGGGKRTAFGNNYAQTSLPAETIGQEGMGYWTGDASERIGLGADWRGRYAFDEVDEAEDRSEFSVTRATLYLEVRLVPNRLELYVDEQIAPGGSINREAVLRLRDPDGSWHLTAGQFYIPFGLRLQDDSAFVRQATGVNFSNPDRGVQLGYEHGPWSVLLAATNGTGGGAEVDSGKQLSAVVSRAAPSWRLGISVNTNDADAGDRTMAGVFAGARTGPVSWLAELDLVQDDLPSSPSRRGLVSLVEANWQLRKGHNLKLSHDYLDPDDKVHGDHLARWSVVWEYTPMQFLQVRSGLRIHDGDEAPASVSDRELFLELHGFF